MSKIKKYIGEYEFFLFIVVILISIIFQLLNSQFFTFSNFFSMIKSSITLGIFSLGVYVIIVSGGIDVSFPAIAIFSIYSTVKLFNYFNMQPPIILIFLVAALLGVGWGLINGIFVSNFNISPLIVTLGTQNLIHGLLLTFIGTTLISNIPQSMINLQGSNLLVVTDHRGWTYGLPFTFLLLIGAILLTWILVKYTKLGRGIYAIGGDEKVAKRMGFDVSKIKLVIYGFAGFLASVGGVIYGAMYRKVDPFSIVGTELTVIAAVILGGTDIKGGQGSVLGVMLGVILMTIIKENLILIGIDSVWQNVMIGIILITSIGITSYRNS